MGRSGFVRGSGDCPLSQASVIDGKNVSTTDTAILWRRISKSHIWMNFPEWLSFVEQLAEVDLSTKEMKRYLFFSQIARKKVLTFTKCERLC